MHPATVPAPSTAAVVPSIRHADEQLHLVIHRSAAEIGGNCIELRTAGARLLLDIGRPLNAPKGATGLLAATLDMEAATPSVLVSHPHQDHYGLLSEAPAHWPVHCGEATQRLMDLTGSISGQPLRQSVTTWKSGQRFDVGPFAVTPLLTDHSAFDAHMLLIEAAGRRVLYSGDFRRHGRKAALVDRLMRHPPANVDALLLEGTNVGSDKSTASEDKVEEDFVRLFKDTRGRSFVTWSAQNVDRTVSIYRACLKAGRTLVVDLYTADVLETLRRFGRLPAPGMRQVAVVITSALAKVYRDKGQGGLIKRMLPCAVSTSTLARMDNCVVMTRSALIRDFAYAGVLPGPDDSWSFSMWRGYLAQPDGLKLQHWFGPSGCAIRHIHTSGHAAQSDLQSFARAVRPRRIIPIHGEKWAPDTGGFEGLEHVADGQLITL